RLGERCLTHGRDEAVRCGSPPRGGGDSQVHRVPEHHRAVPAAHRPVDGHVRGDVHADDDLRPEGAQGGWPAVTHYDVVVVGSGFGGSVTALRLAEKGYRVHVIESGKRFHDQDFARTSWDLRNYLWAPRLKCFGVQRIHRLPDVMVLA